MDDEINYYNKNSTFIFEGNDKTYKEPRTNRVFRVSGKVIDAESHSFLRINYDFLTLKEAKKYFDHIKNSYPKVNIKMYKYTWQLCRFLG